MDKRFCIFDMDGTLVDSMGIWKNLEVEFLRSKGITGDLAPLLAQTKPMTTMESTAFFIRECGLDGTPESLSAEMNEMMAEHYRTDVMIKPGAKEYLQHLKAQGAVLCVASATAPYLLKICADRLGLTQYFDFILSCAEVGSGKNKPLVFLEAARRMGSTPAETAVFEDSLTAATTAKAAGFYTVGIRDIDTDEAWQAMQALADETLTDWRTYR